MDITELKTKALSIKGITVFEYRPSEALVIGNRRTTTRYDFAPYRKNGAEEIAIDKETLSNLESRHERNSELAKVNSNARAKAFADEYLDGYMFAIDWKSAIRQAKEELQDEQLYRDVIIPFFEDYIKQVR